ncbi:hypothetical protein RCH06_003224 [Polaromonas sp. CG_9.5]|nr:hypothetical protein [Polaromonas sp. CG_9.5]
MTPKNLNPSPLENTPLPNLAMNPATARLPRRALAARFTPHFIA